MVHSIQDLLELGMQQHEIDIIFTPCSEMKKGMPQVITALIDKADSLAKEKDKAYVQAELAKLSGQEAENYKELNRHYLKENT